VAKVKIEGVEYDFDPSKLMFQESLALQRETGLTMQAWLDDLGKGDVLATGAMVWLIRRRAGDETPFATFDFDLGSIEMESSASPGNAEVPAT